MNFRKFSKILILPKTVSEVTWGIGGMFVRAGTAPGGLLRRLRRPQEAAGGAEVSGMSRGESTWSHRIMGNHENPMKSPQKCKSGPAGAPENL